MEASMKFVRVNMTDKTIRVEDVPPEYAGLDRKSVV